MVGKENTTLTERRNSQDSNRSLVSNRSSQESNNLSFHQHMIDEEVVELGGGINVLPERKIVDASNIENNPLIGDKCVLSEVNEDVNEIENSPPKRTSMKRSSSLDLETVMRRIKRKSSVRPETNEPNPFDLLSDEVMLLIFSFLNKKTLVECCQVSKRWKQIACDDSLWTRIDVSSYILNTFAISSLLERNPKFLRMSQTHFKQINPIGRYLKTEYLDLSMAKISIEDLRVLIKHFTNLKKLSLENVACDISVCESLIENRNLNCLNLTMCKGICEHFLRLLLTHCTNLTSLNLSWCNLNLNCVEVLIQCLNSNLINLNLSGCVRSLQNVHVEKLGLKCPNLIELDLSEGMQLGEEVIDILVKHFVKLETLSLSRCYNIPPSKYANIMNAKSSLKNLNIHGLLHEKQIELLQKKFSQIAINKQKFSIIARPTVGEKRTSIWGFRVRDSKDS